MSTIAARGYTVRLALRHLLTGWTKPRSSVREARSAGIGEGGRIVLFAVSAGLCFSLDPTVRSAFSTYVERVRHASGAENLALGVSILLAALSLLVFVLYMVECIVLYAALRICTPDHRSFATTRFMVAIGNWITTIPISVAFLLGGGVAEVSSPASDIPNLSAWFSGPVGASYFVLYVSETVGVSLVRSTMVVLIALVGCLTVYIGLDAGLERLNEVLRGFVPDDDFT